MTALCKRTFILFLLVAIPSIASAEVIDSIAAIVNDDPITSYEIDREVARIVGDAARKPGPTVAGTQLRTTALDQMIDKRLAEQKIKELDIKVSDDEVRQAIEDVKKQNNLTQEALVSALQAQGLSFDQYKTQLREQIERLRLMGQEVRSKVQVGEKEVRAFYDSNPARFGDEVFQARHIYFKIDDKTPPADVKRIMATAMSVLQEARSGKDFADLAKQYSDDQLTAKEGGELGTFKKGETLPEIEKTVEAMTPGDISDLVKTPAGFHIIKLEKKFVKSVKSFDEAKGEIEDLLYRKKSEERYNQWIADLRKAAAIEIKQ
ncbi:MAG TPA: peptidylprolyl isomerase [Geobacteraceae bacterium]